MIFDHRLFHLMKKEFIQLLRDRRLIGFILVAPVIQLLIFGYVATTDVRDIPAAFMDSDKSRDSRQLLSSFKNSGYFILKYEAGDQKHEKMLLDSGRVKAAINIPPEYSRDLKSKGTAKVQFIVDGTNSNVAGIAMGYISGIVYQDSLRLLEERYGGPGGILEKIRLIEPKVRIFHNQQQKSINYMVPGVIAVLLMMLTSILTSVSIVKEKESGTLEQIIVTPIKPYELMLGKMVPYIILAFIDMVLVIMVGSLWFGVPILGSIVLLVVLSLLFILTSLGVGLYISTISSTMQQTILSVIFFMIPSMLLSGFIFPIDNMPDIIKAFTYIIPMRYFLTVVRGIFLKGIGIEYLWGEAAALFVLGAVIFSMAVVKFKKKLG
ncbi:MAG: ABC transporter permease [Candidatus Margulisiibacteriota bacterium]